MDQLKLLDMKVIQNLTMNRKIFFFNLNYSSTPVVAKKQSNFFN